MNRVLRWAFLRGFTRALKRQCKWAPEPRELEAVMADLSGAQHLPGGDRQAEFNLLLAQSLQAAVRVFQGRGYARARSVEMAREAFLQNGSGLTRMLFAWWLKTTKDPVADMKTRRDLAETARKMWGKGMEVSEVHEPDRVALHVHACPFAAYFWGVAEPDLTLVLCAYDAQWMAQVNRSKRPVHVSRAGTIAQGAEQCDFTFSRTQGRVAVSLKPAATGNA